MTHKLPARNETPGRNQQCVCVCVCDGSQKCISVYTSGGRKVEDEISVMTSPLLPEREITCCQVRGRKDNPIRRVESGIFNLEWCFSYCISVF